MKIAIIGQKGIPSKFGGVEKHVEELSVRLAAAGHEVIVYTRKNYTPQDLKEYKGVKLVSLPNLGTKHLDAISHTFNACLDVIFRRKVDIVHFHSIGPSSLIWLVKLFKPGTPVVATFHTQCYFHKKWNTFARLYLKFGEYVCCRLANKTITVSKTLKEYARQKYGIDAVYIPNGVPRAIKLKAELIKKWGLDEKNYILSVSRLVKHKGIHHLIKAYLGLATDKKLVIVGDHAYTDDYTSQLKELAAGHPNIVFTGNQNGAALQELFSNAAIFVQPSESEGLSIALLEAISFGLPVLVSDIPENKEVVQDYGYYFKVNDSQDLKLKLPHVLHEKEESGRFADKALTRILDEYDWEKITENVIKIYRSVLYPQDAF